MSDLLSHFEGWAATSIGALNYTVAALVENVVSVVAVWNCFALALVVKASEGSAIEH